MAIAEYKRPLTDAYDLDKPEAPPEARGLLEGAGFVRVHATKAFTSLPLDGNETMVSLVAVKPERERRA
jgi:hypothetical protein